MELYEIIYFIIIAITLISLYKIFQKAHHPGWKALIPIYNLFIIQDIIRRPWWWALLMLIPFVGIIWTVLSTYLLGKAFHKNNGFIVGMVILPFIFYPLLAFDKSVYLNPLSDNSN